MPRRAANRSQSTLSFGGRVTKPVTAPSHKAKALESTPSLPDTSPATPPEPQQLPVTPNEPSKPHVAELAVRQQAAVEHQAPLSEEDKRALKLNKQDIWRYWQAQEKSRMAPRAHQEGMDVEEKILRHFDLSSQYGPCIGIARVKRWRRANQLKLNPPIEVLAVLLKGKNTKERAHIDELLS
ncbi:DNA polymerase delta, subunit 4 [Penicillium griseofulvum]|uniref:DNA polymerase delta, subunit 4 n=1 Tax=Penicillium patulum TaxID=5078 RepID=A0A135LV14_PENPA|nr:DNA polymerase delta, subunit 4 [Penicillium griseofulvum]KXG52813.1 DNA polymerase delta, subunit 4 [Penicillium griseofulvum]